MEEALGRARIHAQNAAVQALQALQAVVEAGARVPGGLTGERAAEIVQSLDALRRWCDPQHAGGDFSVLEGVERFLDREIERYEAKSRTQPELRTLLRALLAVREVVFEFSTAGAADAKTAAAPAADPAQAAAPVENPATTAPAAAAYAAPRADGAGNDAPGPANPARHGAGSGAAQPARQGARRPDGSGRGC